LVDKKAQYLIEKKKNFETSGHEETGDERRISHSGTKVSMQKAGECDRAIRKQQTKFKLKLR